MGMKIPIAILTLVAATSCIKEPRAAVSLHVVRANETPADASVTIDEEYIGPLGWVAARGVRLPVGEHRISIEKTGYFPADLLVVADRKPIKIEARLVPIPD